MASSSKHLPLYLAGAGVAFGLLFVLVGAYLRSDARDLRRTGTTVTASVLKKYAQNDGASWSGLETKRVQAAFANAAGVPQSVELPVQAKLWNALEEGGTMQVSWIPGDLASARPGALFDWKLRGAMGAGLIAMGCLVSALFPLAGIREWLK